MLRRLIKKFLQSRGWALVYLGPGREYPPAPIDSCLGGLARLGFRPKSLIDVGANHGAWTMTALRHFPDVSCTLVEPQAHLKSFIEPLVAAGKKIHWVTAGAGAQNGSFPLYMNDRDNSCSFSAATKESQGSTGRTVEVEVLTLDELLRRENLPVPELVKIDAEGLDLEVIDGAGTLIGKTEVFFLEASVLCQEFANTLSVTLQKMDALGYQLFDITDCNRSPKQDLLWLVEAVFIRKGSPLLKGLQSYA